MPHYYFIRHGESEANRDDWLAGHRDSPLTERGREQAREVHPRIAALEFQAVLVSDLSRARETASLVLSGRNAPIRTTPLLRERSGGVWEGRSLVELRTAGHLKRIRAWHERPPEGESLSDIARRALSVLADTDEGQDVLVVAHGALIRALIHVLDHGPDGELSGWKPGNAEVVHRTVQASHWAALLTQCEAAAARHDGDAVTRP